MNSEMEFKDVFEEDGKICDICERSELFKYNLKEMKYEALRYTLEFTQRGLYHGAKWLSELVYSLRRVELGNINITYKTNGIKRAEYDKYLVAFAYFKNQEYNRCAAYLKGLKCKLCHFLRYYALFLGIEMKRIMDVTDTTMFNDVSQQSEYSKEMSNLADMIKYDYIRYSLDGYELYIYGLVLKRLRLLTDARDIFIESIRKLPINWNAWQELVPLISEKESIEAIGLPDHWLKDFFWAQLFMDFHMSEKALEIYKIILHNKLHTSHYIQSQIAVCQHNIKDFKNSYDIFKKIRNQDCYRLDCMDVYSNLLYIGQERLGKEVETRSELVILAHQSIEVNKYKPETCCIIGNYYSARGEFVKAAENYKRGVRLNPYFGTGWTLMGHEYMELKNTGAAILSYRKAISCNGRDFRAWFGLGQTYEIASLPSFALYYYKIAHSIKPNDSRMLMAMAETYERIEKLDHAIKAYLLVNALPEPDPLAAIRLAKLHCRVDAVQEAVQVYSDIVVKKATTYCTGYKKEYADACIFLCKHYLGKNNTDSAVFYAQLLLKLPDRVDDFNKLMADVAKKSEGDESDDLEMQVLEEEKSSS